MFTHKSARNDKSATRLGPKTFQQNLYAYQIGSQDIRKFWSSPLILREMNGKKLSSWQKEDPNSGEPLNPYPLIQKRLILLPAESPDDTTSLPENIWEHFSRVKFPVAKIWSFRNQVWNNSVSSQNALLVVEWPKKSLTNFQNMP